MQNKHALELLAVLLEYPSADYMHHLETLLEDESNSLASEARPELQKFAAQLQPLTAANREELYTRTFDINPVASLEVGWHLYGEQYERGSFLVRMRERLEAFGIPEGTELPDHLASAVRLCAVENPEAAAALFMDFIAPAIGKMLGGLKQKENPYRHLIAALQSELTEEFSQLREEEHHV